MSRAGGREHGAHGRHSRSRAQGVSPGAVAGLVVLASLIRLLGLGQHSIWTDEMHTILVAGIPYAADAPPWRPSDLLVVTQGPLFMGLAHLWSVLFGLNEAALRSLPALFAIATVPVFVALAARLAGRDTALLAGLVLAVSPFHVWYAQELRGYSMVIFAAVLATLFLIQLFEEGGGLRRYVLYGVSLLVAFGASLTASFLALVHALWAVIRWPALGWRRVAALGLIWLLVLIAASQWLGVFGERTDIGRAVDRPREEEAPLRGETTMHLLAGPYTFYAFAAGFSLGPTPEELHLGGAGALRRHWPIVATVAVTFGGLALLGLRELIARRPLSALLIVVWIAVPFVITGWMAASNVKVWNARYLAVTFPAFLIVVARGLAALRGRVQVLGLLLVLGTSLFSIWNLRRDPAYAKEDYRSAGAFLGGALAANDALIGVGAPAPVFFYTGRRPASYRLVHPDQTSGDRELRAELAQATAGCPRVWLLRARPYQSDPGNRVGEILGEMAERVERVTFPGIELERYDRRVPATEAGPTLPGEEDGPRSRPDSVRQRGGGRDGTRRQSNRQEGARPGGAPVVATAAWTDGRGLGTVHALERVTASALLAPPARPEPLPKHHDTRS